MQIKSESSTQIVNLINVEAKQKQPNNKTRQQLFQGTFCQLFIVEILFPYVQSPFLSSSLLTSLHYMMYSFSFCKT